MSINPATDPRFALCSGDLLTAKFSDLAEYIKTFVSEVPTKYGLVQVITLESPGDKCFNTCAVPSDNYKGSNLEEFEGAVLVQGTMTIDINLKEAAKTHKERCQGLDAHNRLYKYDHTLKSYVPIDKEQEQRISTSEFTTGVGAPFF